MQNLIQEIGSLNKELRIDVTILKDIQAAMNIIPPFFIMLLHDIRGGYWCYGVEID